MTWLSKLDPNVAASWAIAALGGLMWLYHKAKGDKTESARSILYSTVTQVVNQSGVDIDNVKARAETAVRAALAKLGITGAIADALVHEFVEYAASELHRNINAAVSGISKANDEAQATLRSLNNPPPLMLDGKEVPRENWAAKPGEPGSGTEPDAP